MKTKNSIPTRPRLIATAAAFAVVLSAAAAQGQTGMRFNGILTDSDAFLLPPPELIAGPVVERITVSPLSRNVCVLRAGMRIRSDNLPSAANPNPTPPNMEYEIVFWNADARKPISLWRSGQPQTHVQFSDWMPTTASLFGIVDTAIAPTQAGRRVQHEFRILLLGSGIERAAVMAAPEGQFEWASIAVSPLKPIAVLQMVPDLPTQAAAYVLLHPNGRTGAHINVPAGARAGILWDEAGSPCVQLPDGTVPGGSAFFAVDTQTGALRRLPDRPKPFAWTSPVKQKLPYRLASQHVELKRLEAVASASALWIETPQKSEVTRALVSADAHDGEFLADGAGVLYQSQYSAWYTPIVRVDKVAFMAARRAAERVVLLNHAKQVGLAAMMFASDNGDVLPGPDGFESVLAPFLQDASVFENFNYTFPGGKLVDVASPSQTELGFIPGPGGRVTVFVDGHATWKNDPGGN